MLSRTPELPPFSMLQPLSFHRLFKAIFMPNMSTCKHDQRSDKCLPCFSIISFRIPVSVSFRQRLLLNALLHRLRPTLPSETLTAPSTQPHPSFLIILRAFLTRAASVSPSLSDLRAVLAEIFQAYAFEARILNLANQFLDKDLFTHVDDAWTRRQKGWRPRGNVCEFCNKRVWGPGVGSGVWEQWEANMNRLESQRLLRHQKSAADVAAAAGTDRGKGKAGESSHSDFLNEDQDPLTMSTLPS